MGRHKANDPDYTGRKVCIPHDFFETISRLTECIPEDNWRINVEGYADRCLALAKKNPLLIWDLTIL